MPERDSSIDRPSCGTSERTIDLTGPAGKLDLRVGDVVTAIDGIDVSKSHAMRADALLAAPPARRSRSRWRGPTTVMLVLGAARR